VEPERPSFYWRGAGLLVWLLLVLARWLLLLAAAWLLQTACIGVSAAPTPSPGTSAETELAESGLAMEVEADPAAPYLQSRIRYGVRILARVPLRQVTLSEPTAEQAVIRRIGDDRRFDIEREGVRYRVLVRLYAVVPQRPRPLRIVAPQLSAAVPVNSMSGQERPQAGLDAVLERLETVTRTGPTLLLEVRPIPDAAELPRLAAESVSISERWEPSDARVRVGESTWALGVRPRPLVPMNRCCGSSGPVSRRMRAPLAPRCSIGAGIAGRAVPRPDR
jgi:hypothetical protein